MLSGGAGYLARIIGTEEDKVNCSFFYKIGACRHGDSCLRLHLCPDFSQTLLLSHLYVPPPPLPDGGFVDEKETYERFYEDMFSELSQYGPLEDLAVCDNLGDHLV
ncbi:Splicing factor U2AF 26 kDa subunit [Bonamia ostreae]|uniref:Splicing factor U2AF 26 kDa subunit n=1 Tax=Bonamia ostreae TaxID=126728 RepID=A0ABV2AVR0_9EUKA